MFGSIRSKGGNASNPTPVQFQNIYKKIFFLNYFQHVEGANCIADLNALLMKYDFSDVNKIHEPINKYSTLDIPESNALGWVAGYLIKKCLCKHSCALCQEYSQKNTNLSNETLLYTFGNLRMPPISFYIYIYELDSIFCTSFPFLSLQNNLGIKVKTELEKVPFTHPCNSFPHNYLLCLYTRMRIFYTLKYANRNFALQKGSRRNKKLVISNHL
ncbi:hypothetical protein ABEB36_014475 [Hypothenemus hampei]|uniref:Transposable element P transposase-like RNase H C-terminal domain-containing protein n=1 Tax=Hypothenemus hampei TaxID=57062 RepID=A0ABD1E261_HYPHA